MGRAVLAAALLLPVAAAAEDARRPVEDVVPLTAANLRGHRMLYDEGWFVVSSSKRAFRFAKEKSLESSGAAIRRALKDAARSTGALPVKLGADARASIGTGRDVFAAGTKNAGRALGAAQESVEQEAEFSKESFQKAFDSFVRGNLSIARRTKEDRDELRALPGGYFKNVRDDLGNVYELSEAARRRFADKMGPVWEGAFEKAGSEFQREYERSGRQANTFLALGPILSGYAKAIYYGVVKPSSKTAVKAAAAGVGLAVVPPLAAATVVAGRTVQATGLTVYYVGKTGAHVLAPTVEAGFFSALALLSAAAVPVTYAAGGAVGAVSQVACAAAAPVAAAGEETARTAYDAGAYAGLLTYDAAAGAARVAINQGESGLVLGYNALTAIPTHALMGAADAAVFLAWDGPRLALASARGRVRWEGKDYSPADLPVGTVVDLQKLRQAPGVKVDVLSTDAKVLDGVLERLPADLRPAR